MEYDILRFDFSHDMEWRALPAIGPINSPSPHNQSITHIRAVCTNFGTATLKVIRQTDLAVRIDASSNCQWEVCDNGICYSNCSSDYYRGRGTMSDTEYNEVLEAQDIMEKMK